ncbi:hypothetical protein ACFQZ4_04550 [Catellatospora coxensis]
MGSTTAPDCAAYASACTTSSAAAPADGVSATTATVSTIAAPPAASQPARTRCLIQSLVMRDLLRT